MREKSGIAVLILGVLISSAFGSEPAKPLSVDTMQVLKISGRDGRAVIKTPDGKMQIIKAGDPIGRQAKVLEITEERIVIEETTEKETEKVIVSLDNGVQHVEKLKKTAEGQSPNYTVTAPNPKINAPGNVKGSRKQAGK